jgi:hypothetical protein
MSISITLNPEATQKGYILVNHSNLLIKYSPSICLGYAGFVFLSYPLLVLKNIFSLGENFQRADEYLKSKMILAVNIILLPTLIFFITSIYFSEEIKNQKLLLLLVFGSVFYVFINNSYIYFIIRKRNT